MLILTRPPSVGADHRYAWGRRLEPHHHEAHFAILLDALDHAGEPLGPSDVALCSLTLAPARPSACVKRVQIASSFAFGARHHPERGSRLPAKCER